MQTFFLQREIIGKRKRLSPQLDELQIKIQKVWRLLLTLAHFVRFYPRVTRLMQQRRMRKIEQIPPRADISATVKNDGDPSVNRVSNVSVILESGDLQSPWNCSAS